MESVHTLITFVHMLLVAYDKGKKHMREPSFQKLNPQMIVDILSKVYERAQKDHTLEVEDLIREMVGQLESLIKK